MSETNRTLMQYFEWYLPANHQLWNRAAHKAPELAQTGINMVWLPPAYKGASGEASTGYDVYDTYDLGEFDQKGGIPTKYGTKEEYLNAVHALQQAGIAVLPDIVMNHMMGADEAETVCAVEVSGTDRNQTIGEPFELKAWTKYTFPGRNGRYSDHIWTAQNFDGCDWDENTGRSAVFRFAGKQWDSEVDGENGSYDYLMGTDIDSDEPDTVQALTDWGRWYIDTVHPDGFRLDAVKHMGFGFYKNWLRDMRAHAGKDLFAVGEYWNSGLGALEHYLDVQENGLSLFDVPLHYSFREASERGGDYDMRGILNGSLVRARPANAVTFIDNHDTQPEQALTSFVGEWFKPIAYSIILLHKDGIPCVFYGDMYGIPHDNVPPVPGLDKLIKIRELFAYGDETEYFDDPDVVGLTRTGDWDHPASGLALLVTNRCGGTKKMFVGKDHTGAVFYDALGRESEPVTVDEEGFGEFSVKDGSLSVYVRKEAFDWLFDIM